MKDQPKCPPAILVTALVYPSLLTLVYFILLQDRAESVQQIVFAAGKLIQFTVPALLVFWLKRGLSPGRGWSWSGAGVGLLFGVLVAGAMFLLYFAVLSPFGWFETAREQVIAKVEGFGVDTHLKYAGLGLFYSIGHSGLEEYYWRWFVFGQLRPWIGWQRSLVVSSLGFMAHHVILLGFFFGWSSPLTYVFSLSVAIGGAAWAWIYHRYQSLAGPWVSHILVDAAIFAIGYDVVRQLL